MNFPTKKYNIIYADPPWPYSSANNAKPGIWDLAQNEYNTMGIDEIKSLPVPSISENNCLLFLWATFPNLPHAFEVIKAWGFEYRTVAFVWEKLEKTNIVEKKYGLGWYTRSNVEVVLLGRKGDFVRQSAAVQQIVKSTISKHSEKPDEVRKRILKLCGDIPRIELFARVKAFGWDAWGNDPKLQDEPLEAFQNV